MVLLPGLIAIRYGMAPCEVDNGAAGYAKMGILDKRSHHQDLSPQVENGQERKG